jgi:hypothetical protein
VERPFQEEGAGGQGLGTTGSAQFVGGELLMEVAAEVESELLGGLDVGVLRVMLHEALLNLVIFIRMHSVMIINALRLKVVTNSCSHSPLTTPTQK